MDGPTPSADELRVDLFQLYEISGPLLLKISMLIQLALGYQSSFPPHTLDHVRAAVTSLGRGINVCGPGIIQNVDEAYRQVSQTLLPPRLDKLILSERVEIAQQILLEFVKVHLKNETNFAGNEIHMVTALQNHFAERFRLPKVDDRYAVNRYVHEYQPHLPYLQNQLERSLRIESVMLKIASHLLEGIQSEWPNEAGKVGDKSMWFQQKADLLSKTFGNVKTAWLYHCDDNGLPAGPALTPTPLAAGILTNLGQVGPDTFEAAKIHGFRPLPFRESVMQAGPLTWVESNTPDGKALRAFELDDFVKVMPKLQNDDDEHSEFLSFNQVDQALLEALRNTNDAACAFSHQINSVFNGTATTALYVCCKLMEKKFPGLTDSCKDLITEPRPGQVAEFLMGTLSQTMPSAAINMLLETPDLENHHWHNKAGQDETFPSYLCNMQHWQPDSHGPHSLTLFRWGLAHVNTNELHPWETVRGALEQDDPSFIEAVREKWHSEGRDLSQPLFDELAYQMSRPNPKTWQVDLLQQLIRDDSVTQTRSIGTVGFLSMLLTSKLEEATKLQILNIALDKGAQWYGADREISTALEAAINQGQHAFALNIIQHPGFAQGPHNGERLLTILNTWLAKADTPSALYSTIVERLINPDFIDSTTLSGMTPQLLSTASRSPQLLDLLVNAGLDPKARDAEGNTALHWIAGRPSEENQIKRLLALGVPNTANSGGKTPAENAVGIHNTRVAALLFQHQGQLDVIGKDGYAPLHRAILMTANPRNDLERTINQQRVLALLSAGANPNLKTGLQHRYKAPLHLAYRLQDQALINCLLQFGADPNQRDFYLRLPGDFYR
ncbi:MAG TPA: hypothetical protein VGE55_02040 [Limnobacter sp.]